MKFYIKKHKIYSDKIKRNLLIAHFSDTCINAKFDFQVFKDLVHELAFSKPDIICFTGNLFEDAVYCENKSTKYLVKNWLDILSYIAPIYIVRGNRDILYKIDGEFKGFYDTNLFFKSLRELNNVHVLLDDKCVEHFNDVTIVGSDYGKWTQDVIRENEPEYIFRDYIMEGLKNVNESLNREQLNIFLFHSPKNLELLRQYYSIMLSGRRTRADLVNFSLFPINHYDTADLPKDATTFAARPITNDSVLVKKLHNPGFSYINVKSI